MACESLRVEQVDANILDREYRELMYQQFEQLTTELPIWFARLCDLFKPEVYLVLDSVIWTTRIFGGASPGQMEMGIFYKDYSRKKIHLHFLLSILVPYFTKRIWSLFSNRTAMKIFSKISAIFETLCILHHLNFLHVGGHSTLVESFLGLRNWNVSNRAIGTVNYESQNRELLWHTFRDALLLLWPVYRAISTKFSDPKRVGLEENSTVALRCGHCGRIAVIPMRSTNCGHIACYWCVTSRAPTDRKSCVICGEEEKRIVPMTGTLLLSGKAGNVKDE